MIRTDKMVCPHCGGTTFEIEVASVNLVIGEPEKGFIPKQLIIKCAKCGWHLTD